MHSNNVMPKQVKSLKIISFLQALERIIEYGNIHGDISDERKEM